MKSLQNTTLEYLYENIHLVDFTRLNTNCRKAVMKYIHTKAFTTEYIEVSRGEFIGLYNVIYGISSTGDTNDTNDTDSALYKDYLFIEKNGYIKEIRVGISKSIMDSLQHVKSTPNGIYFNTPAKLCSDIYKIGDKILFKRTTQDAKTLYFINNPLLMSVLNHLKTVSDAKHDLYRTFMIRTQRVVPAPPKKTLQDICMVTLANNVQYLRMGVAENLIRGLKDALIYAYMYPRIDAIIMRKNVLSTLMWILYPDMINKRGRHDCVTMLKGKSLVSTQIGWDYEKMSEGGLKILKSHPDVSRCNLSNADYESMRMLYKACNDLVINDKEFILFYTPNYKTNREFNMEKYIALECTPQALELYKHRFINDDTKIPLMVRITVPIYSQFD